ncbi:MAG: glycosyltransferase [Deltaproteobacteria bacterium]|jgi:glycosyltransferase involved in cell wall biosynthesis|nr:glycosyltransferase [Deltaproteobacteria bacterium]
MEPSEYPFLSVIVPVYNDNAGLEKLLPTLMQQSYPQDKYEVIIVDNGSRQNVIEVTKDFAVKLLTENDIQSSYAARNKGIQHARGEVFVFIDSDCRAADDWLFEGIKRMHEAGSDLVGGNVVFSFSKKKASAEYYDAIYHFQFEDMIKRGTCGGGNTFVKRSVFDSIGMFPSNVKSGGDVFFTKKATASGFKLVYAPKAIVYHPTRKFWPLAKKMFRMGKGKAKITEMSEALMGEEKIRTIQSGGLWQRLNPLELRRKIARSAYPIGMAKYILILSVTYAILSVGLAGFLYGKTFRK